jgi:shikimate kinase
MGSGKSTIGQLLARRLGLTFLDSDREIELRTGVDIPTVFDIEGEDGFRQRERKVIDELTRRAGIVLATGGGAVISAENRDVLASRGTVIYLEASVEQQLARTSRDRNRPLLQTSDRRARLEALLAEREPLYRSLADIIIKTDGRTAKAVARQLAEDLGIADVPPGESRARQT